MDTDSDPLAQQRHFWNGWNSENRERSVQDVSLRQAEVVLGWLERLGRRDLNILEVGCGTGWLCPKLLRYGRVTGTDLSDEVLDRARSRVPGARFVAGDFMKLAFDGGAYDVVVALEVLSHVADQQAFAEKVAGLVKPDGYLMLATQNRVVLERFNRVPPPGPGQLRRWLDRRELAGLLKGDYAVEELFSVSPKANKGVMRLINSRTLNRPVRLLVGDRFERLKERLGLGWTLMALARKT